ncbi:MAG: hypothetical protein L0K41_09575, partial [Yaniella sp.]|nr:hypothetical protein [Yaniella sp.]
MAGLGGGCHLWLGSRPKLMPFCNEVQQFVVSEVSDIISALSLLRAPSTNVSVPGGGLVTHLQSVRRRQLLNLIR